jgi:hypothetical protein
MDVRIFRVAEATDREGLMNELLKARLGAGKSDAAMAALEALNPNLDLHEMPAGTVVLVPDTASFKASASESIAGFQLLR